MSDYQQIQEGQQIGLTSQFIHKNNLLAFLNLLEVYFIGLGEVC
jgi:hypothetical protein